MKLTSCSDGRKVGLPLYTAPPPHLPHAVHLPWLGAFRQAQLRKVGQAAQPSVEGDEDTVVLEGGGGGERGVRAVEGVWVVMLMRRREVPVPFSNGMAFDPPPPSPLPPPPSP